MAMLMNEPAMTSSSILEFQFKCNLPTEFGPPPSLLAAPLQSEEPPSTSSEAPKTEPELKPEPESEAQAPVEPQFVPLIPTVEPPPIFVETTDVQQQTTVDGIVFPPLPVGWRKLPVNTLRELCMTRGLDRNGTKPEIIARLAATVSS